MRGIETIGFDRPDSFRPVLVEMVTRPIKRDGHYMPQVVLIDPNLLLRVFQQTLQFALLFCYLLEADAFVIVHFGPCAVETLGIALRLDCPGDFRGSALTDA